MDFCSLGAYGELSSRCGKVRGRVQRREVANQDVNKVNILFVRIAARAAVKKWPIALKER